MVAFPGVVFSCGLVVVAAGCGASRDSADDDVVRDDAQVIDAPAVDAVTRLDAPETPWIPDDCRAAADRGVAWLVTQQNLDGSFGPSLWTATTAFAVLKLETHAAELGLSPFDPAFAYHDRVAAGLDFLFRQARTVQLTPQLHGNPDSDGNGIGVSFGGPGTMITYEHSITTMAIAAGGDPARVVTAAGTAVVGRTFREVVQDAVDWLAWGQSDSNTAIPNGCRGGWQYTPFQGAFPGVGDNSVTQWVTLALQYARHPLYHYEIPMPPWVKAEVREWVTCIQNHGGGFNDGGSGYTTSGGQVNAYKTGALIQQASFLGDAADTPDMMAAQKYLQRVWNVTTGAGWREETEVSDYLAMYSIMKGMESMAITQLGPIDWYREFCDQLKVEQRPDGSWPRSQWAMSSVQSTLWALLTLERAAPPREVIP